MLFSSASSHSLAAAALLLIVSTTSLLQPVTANATVDTRSCYWPNGNRAPSYLIPCNSDQGSHTHCCWAGELCLNNGLCFGSKVGMPYRGACTDSRWDDKKCPSVCQQVNADGANNLWKCEAPTDQSKWDCGRNLTGICKNATNTFSWPGGNLYKIAGDLPRTSTVDASGNPLSATISGTATSAPTNTNSNNNGDSRSIVLGVGLGLGIPLVLVCLLLGVWLWRERKLRADAVADRNEANSALMGRHSNSTAAKMYSSQQYDPGYDYSADAQQPYQRQSQQPVFEMGNSGRMSEMETSPRTPVVSPGSPGK